MIDKTCRRGTRLCYKKNENGYCWVTDHRNGKLTYIREGNTVTVPDRIIGTRLFETRQEAREQGAILDSDYEQSDRA